MGMKKGYSQYCLWKKKKKREEDEEEFSRLSKTEVQMVGNCHSPVCFVSCFNCGHLLKTHSASLYKALFVTAAEVWF